MAVRWWSNRGVAWAASGLVCACGLNVVGTAVGSSPEGVEPGERGGATLDGADGLRDGGGGADGSADATVDGEGDGTAPCVDAGACERVVFASSVKYDGNLGGPAGANAKCNALAASADAHPRVAGRTFTAWLATASESPASTLARRGWFVRADGKPIASSWDDMTDGLLTNPIEIDERGGVQTIDDDDVWTGATTAGASSGTHCLGWTSSASGDVGTIGLLIHVDLRWTAARTDPCNDTNHIYCVED